MATSTITNPIVLKGEKSVKAYNDLMNVESPCKDIQPVSDAEIQKGKEYAKKWLAQHR